MTAFELESEVFGAGFDLSRMREEWMKVSNEKGWLITEEGWRRFLSRALDTGRGPRRSQPGTECKMAQPSAAFCAWWSTHCDSIDIDAKRAFNCQRYMDEFRRATRPATQAA